MDVLNESANTNELNEKLQMMSGQGTQKLGNQLKF